MSVSQRLLIIRGKNTHSDTFEMKGHKKSILCRIGTDLKEETSWLGEYLVGVGTKKRKYRKIIGAMEIQACHICAKTASVKLLCLRGRLV